jgi:putative permease
VGIATYIGFAIFNLNYASLLAVLVGLSVILPYIGVVIVSIPVAIVGLLQYGLAPEFAYMFGVYLVIQLLDGNLLVPIIFSEAVNLHPVAIIASVLFFGGIWGFWGLFFAIPLATLVKAVINAWRRHAKLKAELATAEKLPDLS